MHQEMSNQKESEIISYIIALSFGIMSSIAFYFFALILFSLIFSKTGNIPQSFIIPITVGIAGIGSIIGGYITAKKSKKRGMLNGMLCAFILFVIMIIGSLIISNEPFTLVSVIRFMLMILTGAIGGIIGVNNK